jgi:glycosyltransferase involved in cell wall biosynthesis
VDAWRTQKCGDAERPLDAASTALVDARSVALSARQEPTNPPTRRPHLGPRVLFLGSAYAGHATRFSALQQHASADPRIRPAFHRVTGWHEGGFLESLPLVPRSVRGRARATLEAALFATVPRPDVIWTSAAEVLTPYLWAQLGPLRRPLVLDLDATWDQLNQMAPAYKGRAPLTGPRAALARWRERALFANVALFTPWSRWAADGLLAAGVPEHKIKVIPPGVNIPPSAPALKSHDGGPLRLLFVGGNFERKGGDMLLDVMSSPLGEQLELDIVTRDPFAPGLTVRVLRLEQVDPKLEELYATADVFVMPSRGECFGLATIEAMARSLPALVSDVGASAEIVDNGEAGWLVRPCVDAVADVLRCLVANRAELPAMGACAWSAVRQRFDASRNQRVLLDLILELDSRVPSRVQHHMR